MLAFVLSRSAMVAEGTTPGRGVVSNLPYRKAAWIGPGNRLRRRRGEQPVPVHHLSHSPLSSIGRCYIKNNDILILILSKFPNIAFVKQSDAVTRDQANGSAGRMPPSDQSPSPGPVGSTAEVTNRPRRPGELAGC